MRIDIPRLLIGAPSSGSGKSTITIGLMAALADSHRVQGFKVGPDYIDPGYHTAATGRISRNLDSWMLPADEVSRAFARTARDADIAIIEGVMGLYDGFNALSEEGSSAHLAKLLQAPVVLVLDVGKMARSAGALALGYRDYDPQLNLAGVICNRVGSPRHAQWVRQAVEGVGIPVLGCIPKSAALNIPERHLGLLMAEERHREVQALINSCAELFRDNIDLDRLWQIAASAAPLELDLPEDSQPPAPVCRIAVARDEAFCFYYEDNLDALRQAGAEVVFFSPLRDTGLPSGCAGIYLGGGYPELYAAQLAQNVTIRREIAVAASRGMPVYAECGGLMVLTEYLLDLEGVSHEMIGLLPGHARMVERLVMGYREVTALQDSPVLAKGAMARGHEFHYSEWINQAQEEKSRAYVITPRSSVEHTGIGEGYIDRNVLASYVHLHFGSNPIIPQRLVNSCGVWLEGQQSQ